VRDKNLQPGGYPWVMLFGRTWGPMHHSDRNRSRQRRSDSSAQGNALGTRFFNILEPCKGGTRNGGVSPLQGMNCVLGDELPGRCPGLMSRSPSGYRAEEWKALRAGQTVKLSECMALSVATISKYAQASNSFKQEQVLHCSPKSCALCTCHRLISRAAVTPRLWNQGISWPDPGHIIA
jgi:hypothetical protein